MIAVSKLNAMDAVTNCFFSSKPYFMRATSASTDYYSEDGVLERLALAGYELLGSPSDIGKIPVYVWKSLPEPDPQDMQVNLLLLYPHKPTNTVYLYSINDYKCGDFKDV